MNKPLDKEHRRQVAIEYLAECTSLSPEKAEAFLEKLEENGSRPLPRLQIRYPNLVETIAESFPKGAIIIFDRDLRYLMVRGQQLKNIGMNPDKMEGNTIRENFSEELADYLEPKYRQALDGESLSFTVDFQNRNYWCYLMPIRENGEVVAGALITWDITASNAHRRLLHLLYKAFDSSREGIMITDAKDEIGEEEILYVNKGFEKMTGYSLEEVFGKNPSLLQGPNTESEVIREMVDTLARGERFEGETFNYRKDGSRYRLQWSIDPVKDATGKITHYISIQRDVTEEWKRKQQLRNMLEEKEVLIKEIHHRVKNNLAVISGLLELKSAKTESTEAREVLRESMLRVHAIAAIHEKLYQTEDFSSISIDNYVNELISYIGPSIQQNDRDIQINTDISHLQLPVTQAVPCGLILNELLSNVYKHAFPDRDQGKVNISMVSKNGNIIMELSDNGVGFPTDIDPDRPNSLGLTLVKTLSQQIDGSYEFESTESGTSFKLQFPEEEVEAPAR